MEIKNIFVSIFGCIGWVLLTYLVWMAFFYGGEEGYVILAFNLLGEMVIELFLFTGILILMLIFSFNILNEKEEE
jgi:hypothetical protein